METFKRLSYESDTPDSEPIDIRDLPEKEKTLVRSVKRLEGFVESAESGKDGKKFIIAFYSEPDPPDLYDPMSCSYSSPSRHNYIPETYHVAPLVCLNLAKVELEKQKKRLAVIQERLASANKLFSNDALEVEKK